MRIIVEGHTYAAHNFEDKDDWQVIQFIHKTPASEGSTVLKTVEDGTTNEELLDILVDRLKYLNDKFPCKENAVAITHIETALLWLNKRTSDRLKRGVEGKQVA